MGAASTRPSSSRASRDSRDRIDNKAGSAKLRGCDMVSKEITSYLKASPNLNLVNYLVRSGGMFDDLGHPVRIVYDRSFFPGGFDKGELKVPYINQLCITAFGGSGESEQKSFELLVFRHT